MHITEILSIYPYQTTRMTWENLAPRQTHFLAYQVSGTYNHTIEGKVYPVSTNGLFFINQKDSYTVKCLEKGHSICIAFRAETDLPTTLWTQYDSALVYPLFLQLMEIRSLENESNYYLACSLLYKILSIVYKNPNQTPTAHRMNKITKAREYIQEHLSEEIKTAKLAQLCGITEKHFRSLFKQQYQVTPTQYIIRLRLDSAVKLLQQGGFAIGEIAEMVGISDIYYFSKLFKKQFGVSPSHFHSIQQ